MRAVLGEPESTGLNEFLPHIGVVYPWIRYLRPDRQLRFEFQKSGGLRMVSILDLAVPPFRRSVSAVDLLSQNPVRP